MRTLYGQQGKAVANVEGDAIYGKDGHQIAYLHDEHLYSMSGELVGAFVGGLVFNSFGAPQAFASNARKTLRPMPPRLHALPPRLAGMGPKISGDERAPIPAFLRANDLCESLEPLRDGKFQ